MKKFFLILSILILIGCSAKKISWESVQESYSVLNNDVKTYLDNTETFTRNDYLDLLNSINDNLANLEAGVNEENAVYADSIYESALILENLASLRNEESNKQISGLSSDIKSLVQAAYEQSEDFDSLKEAAKNKINEVLSWPDEMFYSLEKKKTISWNDVETEYQEMLIEAEETLTRRKDITEIELEELKNYIINNHSAIAYGVEKKDKEVADELYIAGYKLKSYCEDIENDAAMTIYQLGLQTMEYVESSYGKKIENPDYDFPNLVKDAEKWTMSLLNEATTQIRR